ncbi:MAG: hypothetical protein ACP5HU_10775 [Phycisphaerae bacterium]
MRSSAFVLTILAVLTALAVPALAEDEQPRPGRMMRGEGLRDRSESRTRSESRIEISGESMRGGRMDMERAEERFGEFSEAIQDHRQELQQWQQKHRELMELYRNSVRTLGEDHEATRAIAKQMREHMEARKQLQENLRRRLADRSQRMGPEQGQTPFGSGMMMRGLDLSPDQREQIQRIHARARKQILHEVLTPEQRRQLSRNWQQMHRGRDDRSEEGDRRWERSGERNRFEQSDKEYEGRNERQRQWDRESNRHRDGSCDDEHENREEGERTRDREHDRRWHEEE